MVTLPRRYLLRNFQFWGNSLFLSPTVPLVSFFVPLSHGPLVATVPTDIVQIRVTVVTISKQVSAMIHSSVLTHRPGLVEIPRHNTV